MGIVVKSGGRCMKKLLIFGMGYVGQHLADALQAEYEVIGTSREATMLNQIKWNGCEINPDIEREIAQADAVLCSIPPDEMGDVAYAQFGKLIQKSKVKWIGYLSTTGVYGDHQGGVVDETTPLNPQNARAKRRVLAEQQWSNLANHCSVNIFRLPGIYGRGRSAFDALNSGRAKRIDMRLKNGNEHFFCRAHVDDIIQVIEASLKLRKKAVNIYNIVDDLPAPQAEIVEYAAQLSGIAVPPLLSEQQAQMSDMAKSFYAECKYMLNEKIKTELGVKLKYANYREGLSAIWQQK